MGKRALRRYHKARMKRRAMEIYQYPEAYKLADHIQCCSRHCCGNPRHHYKGVEKITVQERKNPFDLSEWEE